MKRMILGLCLVALAGTPTQAGSLPPSPPGTYNAGTTVDWQGFAFKVIYGTATVQSNGNLTLTTGSTGVAGDNQGLISLYATVPNNGGVNPPTLPQGITQASFSFDQQNGKVGMFVYLTPQGTAPQPRFEVGSIFGTAAFSEALDAKLDPAATNEDVKILGADPANHAASKTFSANFSGGILNVSTTNSDYTNTASTNIFQSFAGNSFAELQLRVRSGSESGSVNLTAFSATPEPATVTMALTGCAFFGLLALRKRRAARASA